MLKIYSAMNKLFAMKYVIKNQNAKIYIDKNAIKNVNAGRWLNITFHVGIKYP